MVIPRLTAVALLALTLAACSTEPPADAAAGLFSGVELPDLNGGQVEGGELAGEDVALWFWAPW